MGAGGKATIGFKYYMGMHMIACYGPVDDVQEIQVGERTAWTGSVTSSQAVSVSAPELFGGEEREGGVGGTIDFAFGESSQPQNAYLQQQLGTNIPAFRGVLGFILNQFYYGNNPYIKNFKFKVKRLPAQLEAGTADINGDANAAHILYEVLTNGDWGMGYPTSIIDLASFTAAAATLQAEGLGLSMKWTNQTKIEEFINQIMDHINGSLYVDLTDGTFHFKLIRDDYVVGNLPVFDETNIVEFESFERRTWGETVNELTVVYRDKETNKDTPVTVQDMGNLAVQSGQIISQTRQYPGISTSTNALLVAQRDLNALSSPLSKVRIKVNRDAFNLNVAEPFVLSWPKLGITQLVCRLAGINTGNLADGHIVLEAVEDVFGLPSSSFTQPQPSGWVTPNNPPQAVPFRKIQEAGYFDIIQILGETVGPTIAADSGFVMAMGTKPTSDAFNYDLQTKVSTEVDYLSADVSADFSPYSTLVAAIPQEVTSIFTYENDSDMDLVEVGDYIQVGDEKMGVTAHDTVLKQLTVNRGLLDTVPVAHALGATLWGNQYFRGVDQTEYVTSEIVDVKMLPKTGLGKLSLSLAPVDTLTMASRKDTPYAPGDVRVEGLGDYLPQLMTSVDLDFSWAHRDRTQQTAPVFIIQTDANVGPEVGVTYSLDLYGDGILKKQVTGLTGTIYSWADELNLPGFSPSRLGPNSVLSGTNRETMTNALTADNSSYSKTEGSGLVYTEFLVDVGGSTNTLRIGVGDAVNLNTLLGDSANEWGFAASGVAYNNGVVASFGSYSAGSVVMVAYNGSTGSLWFGVDGVWKSGNPSTGIGPMFAGLPSLGLFVGASAESGEQVTMRTEGEFTYTLPTGFSPWSTTNSDRFSEIREVLWAVRDGYDSFQKQDYTFRRADYGYSYGMYYGGV